MRYTNAIGNVEIERLSAVALYDPSTGNIVHLHQCVTLKGGEHPTRKQLERDARQGLKQVAAGRRVRRRLLALNVDPRALDMEHHYKVDPQRRLLVKTLWRGLIRRKGVREGKG